MKQDSFRLCWCDINEYGVIVSVIVPIQKVLNMKKYIESFMKDFDIDFYYTVNDYKTIIKFDSEKEESILIIFRGDLYCLPERLRYFIKILELEYINEGEKN